jgi:hypothetical protein
MKSQNGFAHAFIVIGIIALLVGALGVVFWKNFLENQSSESSASSNNRELGTSSKDQKNSDNSADKVIPSDWATYSGTALPITFRYPSGWKHVYDRPGKNTNMVRMAKDPNISENITFSILEFKNSTSNVSTFCSVNLPDDVKSCEQYVTQNMVGTIIEDKAGGNYTYQTFIGRDLYTMITSNNLVGKDTFKKILQTVAPKE